MCSLGRQSDKDGNTADWWSQQTIANYLERAQCFIDQYDNYYPPVFNGTIHVSLETISNRNQDSSW